MKVPILPDKDRLNREDLIRLTASQTDRSQALVEEVILEFLGFLVQSVREGKSALITGFGTFSPDDRDTRTGRNPATDQLMKVPAQRRVKFTAGTLFVQYVNGRELPVKGPIIAKAPRGAETATTNFVRSGSETRTYTKKEQV